MATDDLNDDLVLSEDQFREVIERATRADLRQDGISVAILRQVAQEMDIDPGALQRALGDVVGVPDVAQPVRGWLQRQTTNVGRLLDFALPKRGRLAAGIVLGTFLGWLTAHVAVGLRTVIGETSVSIGSSSFVDVPVFVLLVVLTLANSLSRRLDGRFDRYLAEVATMWGAFALSWSITSGGSTSDLATSTLIGVLAAAAWGWVVVRRNAGPRAGESVRVADRAPASSVRPRDGNTDVVERRSHGRWLALITSGLRRLPVRRGDLALSDITP